MLKDSEWLALVKLLDDEDPEVRKIAHDRLALTGSVGITKLSAFADEAEDYETRNQILEIVRNLITDEVSNRLLAWRKGGGEDLLEGWNCLAALQKDGGDVQKINGEITRLTNKIWLEMNDQMFVMDKLRIFNHVFFVMEGYHFDKVNPTNPALCFPGTVLSGKKGNVQSLSLLYLIVALRLELPVAGVIVPEYNFIYCHEDRQPFYIDVANNGNFISREGVEVFFRKLGLEDSPSWYKPTSKIRMMLNLLQVMRKNYYNSGQVEDALRLEQILEAIDIRFE